MIIFKWKKDGKLYTFYRVVDKVIALPYDHKSSVIVEPNLEDFFPVKTL